MDKDIQDIKRRAGITKLLLGENRIYPKSILKNPDARMIWDRIWDSMQEADKMSEQDPLAYVNLMRALSTEAHKRAVNVIQTQGMAHFQQEE